MKILKTAKYKKAMTEEEKQRAKDITKSDSNFLEFLENKKQSKEE
jgi:hypothetical protein